MKSKYSIFTIVIAVALAAVMLCMPQLQSLAAEVAPTYISDIKIGYGDSGKQALIDAGYTVWEELNANEGGNGTAVWIGYTTTLDSSEAVTDIATMNMTGGYSFEAYENELKEISANVDTMLSSFKNTIAEFRANYTKKSPYAQAAYKMLSKITEDDTNQTIADMMLDADTSETTLHTVFMQGNSEILNYIYNALALACTEWNGDNFLDRLAEAEYSDEITLSGNKKRTQIANVAGDFTAQLKIAETHYNNAAKFENTDAYISSLEEDEKEDAAYYIELYTAATSVQYGNIAELLGVDSFTLFDAMMLPTEYTSDDELYLDDAIIDMLAGTMTEGQVGSVGTVGIATLVMDAVYAKDNNAEYAEKTVESIEGKEVKITSNYFDYLQNQLSLLNDVDAISVYSEVDRTLFSDIDTVALTSEALREKASKAGDSFGRKTCSTILDSAALKITLATLSAVSGAVAIGCGVCVYAANSTLELVGQPVAWYVKGFDEGIDLVRFASKKELSSALQSGYRVKTGNWEICTDDVANTTCCFGNYSAGIAKTVTIVGTVAAIACLVLTVMTLITYLHKPQTKVNYTQIPRVLVDLKYDENGNKAYYNYYAAKLITAEEGETDSLKLYGDLNGLNDVDQWDVLYFSKDARLGNALTTDILVKSDVSSLTLSETNDYKAIHDFTSQGATNLNKYNTNGSAKAIYVLVKLGSDAETEDAEAADNADNATATPEAEENSNTGSVFSKAAIIPSIICLVAGAGLATLATALIMKKKMNKA